MDTEETPGIRDVIVPHSGHQHLALQNLSSEELAWRAGQGCQASFAELVKRYAPKLQAFLYRRTHDVHDAEDLVQETFARAYENLGDYRDSWRFSTWLYTIARRLAVNHHRKVQVRVTTPPAAECSPSPSEVLSDREQQHTLWAMARRLPENQYQVLWLKYAEGLSVKEIAKAMGKSQINIKVLLYRARTGMARQWQQDDPDRRDGKSQ